VTDDGGRNVGSGARTPKVTLVMELFYKAVKVGMFLLGIYRVEYLDTDVISKYTSKVLFTHGRVEGPLDI
jgi:hypothetical protein